MLNTLSSYVKLFCVKNNLSSRFLITSVLMFFLYLVFRFPINKYFISTILKPIFCHIESFDIYDNIAFIISIIIIIILTVVRTLNEFIISVKRFWLLTLFVILYLILYRQKENEFWSLSGPELFFPAKYLDIVCVYWFLNLCLLIRNNYGLLRKNETINPDSFYEDTPETFSSNDLFNRKNISNSLFNYISNTNNNRAFAIGITGKWGSGKTVFLNMLESSLSDQNWIIIKFNPWRNENPENIIKDFFNQLTESLNKYDEDIERLISKYFYELLKTEQSIFQQVINLSISLLTQSESIKILYDKLNNSIKKLDKKVIIFIDDIDRLNELEVLEVLRIVRNTADFGNIFFILAFDKNYVNTFIDNRNSNNSSKFLEKIIQFEIQLEHIDPATIRQQLLKLLSQKLNALDSKKLVDFLQLQNIEIEKHINQLRDVVRFSNIFVFNYKLFSTREDIILEEFFLLELYKYSYPKDYENLFLHLKNNLGSNIETNDIDNELNSPINFERNDIVTYLFDLNRYDFATYTAGNIEHNSIRRKFNLFKYFTLQIFKNDISYKDIDKLLAKENLDEILNNSVLENEPSKIVRKVYDYVNIRGTEYDKTIELFNYILRKYRENPEYTINLMFSYTKKYLSGKTVEEQSEICFYLQHILLSDDDFIVSEPNTVCLILIKISQEKTILNNLKADTVQDIIIGIFDAWRNKVTISYFNITQINAFFYNLFAFNSLNFSNEQTTGLKGVYLNFVKNNYIKLFLQSLISNPVNANHFKLNNYYYLFLYNNTIFFDDISSKENEAIKEFHDFSGIYNRLQNKDVEIVWDFNILSPIRNNSPLDYFQNQQIILIYDSILGKEFSEIQNNLQIDFSSRTLVLNDKNALILTCIYYPNKSGSNMIHNAINAIKRICILNQTYEFKDDINGLIKIFANDKLILEVISIQPKFSSIQLPNSNGF